MQNEENYQIKPYSLDVEDVTGEIVKATKLPGYRNLRVSTVNTGFVNLLLLYI